MRPVTVDPILPRRRGARVQSAGAVGTATPPLRSAGRWRVLIEAGAVLDGSLDYEATLRNVVRLVVPAIADFCTVLLLDERGAPSHGASAADDPGREQLLRCLAEHAHACTRPGHPVARSLESREAGVHVVTGAALRRFATSDEHLAILRAINPSRVLVVPLTERERVLGALILGTAVGSGRRLGVQDLALGRELGRRASLAIAHAQMYAAAQAAIRTRDQLVATLSHDLKSPIGTARMAIDIALEILPDDEAHHAARAPLAAGRRAADRMLRLVHDLLDVAAIEAGRIVVAPTAEDVEALVADAVDGHLLAARAKGIELDRDVARGLPPAHVDRERILQVFSNLIGNAVKFTPAGGRIRVSASRCGAGLRFAVADTGPGIAAAELPHVFDRFWRADRGARSGTGLGLAIARGIIAAHGETMEVRSQPGAGSEFAFTMRAAGQSGGARVT